MQDLGSVTRWILLAVCFLYVQVNAYPQFKSRIPNENSIADPCPTRPNNLWYGVGHHNPKGSGVRNPFGEDFARFGFRWNKCICELDSDGDNRTNGVELGDPDCTWTEGTLPPTTAGLTHPGVCEPVDSPACASVNSWLNCTVSYDWECDAINGPNVNQVTLNFPETVVPAQETTYICKAFNLSAELPAGDSHLIAVSGDIDNSYVIHHILAYGCTDQNGIQAMDDYSTPQSCDMVTSLCSSIIGMWTVGADGICYHNNTGFKLGENGFKYLIMEFHWNNPELRTDYTDGSGLTFYTTQSLRQYDSAIMFVGPAYIQIPPKWQSFNVYGGCSADCLDLMVGNETLYVTHIIPHMHYKGASFTLQIVRTGAVHLNYVVQTYFYDDPTVTAYTNPIEILPGDEISVTCTYNTKTVNDYIYEGDATSDEMCFGILIYYPYVSSHTFCRTVNGYGFCADVEPLDPLVTGVCDYNDFFSILANQYQSILFTCDQDGLACTDSCSAALQSVTGHACLTETQSQSPIKKKDKKFGITFIALLLPISKHLGTASGYMKSYTAYNYGDDVMQYLSSCDPKPSTDSVTDTDSAGVCAGAVGGLIKAGTCNRMLWSIFLACIVNVLFVKFDF